MNTLAVCVIVMVTGATALGATAAEMVGKRFDASLASPAGPLRFEVAFLAEGNPADRVYAVVVNGSEQTRVPAISVDGDSLVLDFDYYDSKITATVAADGSYSGEWRKRRNADEWVTMAFEMKPWKEEVWSQYGGASWGVRLPNRWSLQFSKADEPAVLAFGGFFTDGEQPTILTATGDYGAFSKWQVEGSVELARFDGAHAFLLRMYTQPDGSAKGDFWSGTSYHDTFTAVEDADAVLPDPFGLTKFTGTAAALDALAFPDVEGVSRRLGEFGGKARIVEVFGTWCPNCRDATNLLVKLDEEYRERGLSIVGVAFEVTGDAARDRAQVKLYAERHGIEYPLLVAGKSDKKMASAAFPVLDQLRAYPTFVFVDGRGEVRGVYSGFSGPATGIEHERLERAFRGKIEEMLKAE